MEKNITIKDIAKQAGVSVATVSYVINNRTDQRISEETRKKVLQIVNLLDYRPNSSAKSLATNKTNHIALYTMKENSILKRSEQLLIIEELSATLNHHGYNLIFQNREDTFKLNQVDAILCFDASSEFFQQIGDRNFIPLLGIDTLTTVPWFFQVCNNYLQIAHVADTKYGPNNYSLVTLVPNNESVRTHIDSTFSEVLYVETIQDILALSNTKDNLVFHHASLLPYLESRDNTLYVPTDMMKKCEQIFTCMEAAINRIPDLEHQYFI